MKSLRALPRHFSNLEPGSESVIWSGSESWTNLLSCPFLPPRPATGNRDLSDAWIRESWIGAHAALLTRCMEICIHSSDPLAYLLLRPAAGNRDQVQPPRPGMLLAHVPPRSARLPAPPYLPDLGNRDLVPCSCLLLLLPDLLNLCPPTSQPCYRATGNRDLVQASLPLCSLPAPGSGPYSSTPDIWSSLATSQPIYLFPAPLSGTGNRDLVPTPPRPATGNREPGSGPGPPFLPDLLPGTGLPGCGYICPGSPVADVGSRHGARGGGSFNF